MPSRDTRTILLWAYAALSAVAALLVASHSPMGAALSMDSLSYLSAAQNVFDGNGVARDTYALSGPTHEPMTLWPPLYVYALCGVLWAADLVGTADVVAISVWNFVALSLTLITFMQIALRVSPTRVAFPVTLALAIAPSLQIVFTYAWSEALFIPLTLAAYLSLMRHLRHGGVENSRALLVAVALLGLATYTRYVGLAFFLAAMLALIFFGPGNRTARVRAVVTAAVTYSLILVPLLIRNISSSGTVSGGNRGTPDTNVISDVSTLSWYLYLEFTNLPVVLGTTVLAVAGASVTWMLFGRRTRAANEAPPGNLIEVTVPLLFISSYLALLLYSRAVQSIDLDTRMLSVIVPYVLILLLGIYRHLATRRGEGLAAMPFVLLLISFVYGGLSFHSSILAGWKKLNEPGPLLGVYYRSLSGRQFDPLRRIGVDFAPNPGDLILTDIRRPVIVDYLFPGAKVRRLPGDPAELDPSALEALMADDGLAIVHGTPWSQRLLEALETHTGTYRIVGKSGNPAFLVVKMPANVK